MNYGDTRAKRRTLRDLLLAKQQGRKISALTCYDAAFAELLNNTDIDLVLVGDSLGNVMLGYESTIDVTLEDMAHHCAAVARKLHRPFLVCDMPFMSYKVSIEQALTSATYLFQKGHCQAVKLEGGLELVPQVAALTSAGLPVMGHLGLTPQSIHQLSGYRVQGKSKVDAEQLVEAALELEKAGAFALVLELVPADLARRIQQALNIPVIGIGAGVDCDGQILVLHDMLGFNKEFQPKFLKKYAQLGELIVEAICQYDQDVKNKRFPESRHSFE